MILWHLFATGLYDVKRELGLVLMTSLVIGTLFLGLALLINWILFHLLIGEKVLFQAAVLLISGSIAYALLEMGRKLAMYRLKIRVTLTQQTALYQHLVHLPLSVYRAHDTAALAQTAYQLSSLPGKSWVECLCLVAEMLPLLIGICIWIPLWMIVSLVIISSLMIWFVTMLASHGWQKAQSSKAFYALTRSMIQSVAKLRISGNMASLLHYWEKNQRQHEWHVRRFAHKHDLVRSILSLGPTVLVMMWGQPDIAASFAAWLFFMRLSRGLQIAADLSSEWEGYRDFLAKMRTTAPDHTSALPILTGDIDVENIVFRYQPSSDPVLNRVSLRVHAGQRAAIVGVSGAGKSTLLRLLAGIDQPESGSIRYDGCDVRQFEGLHRQIGVVLQDSKISTGSIWSNINGFTQYPIDAAWAAARKATIAEVIEGLLMKMHTLVDEHAAILSRGQAQRLVLARALIHQPQILLLDEATSAVDDETQAKIFENLADYTVIITAQRVTTLQHMDVIFVLHEGRIAEQGSYRELIERNGVFGQLIQRQLI